MSKIETIHTKEPVCPYCGHVQRDAWELNLGPGLEGDGEMDCGECERSFVVSRYCDITYKTKPMSGI